ncbi:MAG: carbon-nitrogen hydrolase family protein [Balneolales bacterium]|nr:carbon-nitrogen hydrolase family protein [Balneolales bacterium]
MEIIIAVFQENIKVAIVQKSPVFLNLSKSVDLALQFVSDASNSGARIVVFPETWLPGYPVWLDYAPNAGIWDHPPAKVLYRLLSDNSIVIGSEYFERLQNAAIQNDCMIVMGAHEKIDRTLYNSIFYFLPDGSFNVHRKLMPTYTERLVWGMGDGSTLPVIDFEGIRVGGLICWEHWMPLARAAMHSQNEFIHIAQWPMVKDLHQIASRNYAFEGQCYVLAAGCTLTKRDMITGLETVISTKKDEAGLDLIASIPESEDSFLLRGGSSIIKPNTDYLVNPLQQKEEIIIRDLDLTVIREGNLFLDTNGHYSRPDVFELKVDTSPKTNVTFEN